MKLFLIQTIGLALTSAAFACPNLNGAFQVTTESSGMTITIVQTACTTYDFTYTFPNNGQVLGKIYHPDGVRYQTYADAKLLVFETASVTSKELLNQVEDYDRVKNRTLTSITHFYLDEAGDLNGEYDYYDYNGKLYRQDKPHFKRLP